MAYEEYDYYNEPSSGSLKESLYQILNGLQDRTKLREAGTSFKEALQLTPNVTESLGRGGVAQAIGTSGDLRDLSNTINSYLPKSVRNFTRAAEFLANPYSTAIQQTAPTTEQTLDFVPRVSAPYEGYKQHETLGEYVAPALGYFGAKGLKAVKDLPIGGTIQDVSKIPLTPKEAEILASQVDELGFHSPLENAILNIKQPKGTGDQFLKQLERTPGVKTEELDVTGVKQYLLDHPTVTKQELLDQMAANRLKLKQKVLTKQEKLPNDEEDYQILGGDIYHDDDYIRSMADDLHSDMKNDPVIFDQEKQALLKADPERYADYETNPYTQARLEEDIDGVLYEHAKTKSEEMYYESPIRSYHDDYGYEIHGNDEMGYSVRGPGGEHVDLGDNIYDIADVGHELRMHHLDNDILDYNNNDADFVSKYEDYVLPGKYENYREMLTTLPRVSEYDKAVANMEAFKKTINERLGKPRGGWDFEELTPQEQMKYDILNERGLRASKDKPTYESGHFDEPNILAHTRLNDRIINGKKTLMVEEIQSDWHQAGRRKGYQTGNPVKELHDYESNLPTRARETIKADFLKNGFTEAKADKLSTSLVRSTDFNGMAKYLDEVDKYTEIAQKAFNKDKLVPDAPFKKNWHELMMKQILNEAVKGDYDAVAFTTGKQQNERYNLAKYLDEVYYRKNDDGTYYVSAIDKNHRSHMGDSYTPDQIEQHLGKDMAKKIVEDQGKTIERSDSKSISGEGLSIGGEGMKGFYDKILPDFVNKYTKKYGMGTKKANIDTVKNQFSDFQNWAINKDPSLHTSFIFDSWSNKDDLFKEWSKSGQKPGEEVHFVELTDAAKKDIKSKGQPLFSGIGLAPAPLLMDYEEDN